MFASDMFSFLTLFLILGFTFILFICINDSVKPSKFPPGPKWIPLIGNYLLYHKLYKKLQYTHLVWAELSNIYGPLLGLKLGKDRIVIASGYEAVKEVLSRDEFNARPDGYFFRLRAFGGRYGLVFVDGDFFKVQKQFCIRHLKSFGFNRSTMEDRISMEVSEFVAAIQEKYKGSVSLPELFQISVINSLWSIVAGESFNADDGKSRILMKHINQAFRMQDMSGGILNQMPVLRFIEPQRNRFNELKFVLASLTSFITELVVQHRQTVSPDDNRDLIDAFINEMNNNHSNASTFSEKQLIILLLDLFLAGTETTSGTLGYAILYLIHFPNIQKMLQEELDATVGIGGNATLNDRPKMKYMEAFFMEVQRHANITPTTVAHRAKQNADIMGYTIPKDAIVIASLYSLHSDKAHWGDPENFRPERFLNENGELIEDQWFLPFGMGKRKCMGETLAKSSMFLFITAILSKYTVKAFDEENLPSLKGLDGATISPTSFQCCFIPRNQQ